MSKKWLVCPLLVVIFIFFSIPILLLSFYLINHTRSIKRDPNLSTLQYQEISLSSNLTTFGFIQTNKKLSTDEFLSYPNRRSNSLIIVSNFANSQFKCHGSCSCVNSKNRRFSSTVLTRSLYLLISAFSSSVALKIASKTFQEKCLQFKSQCDEESIISEITSCSEEDINTENEESEFVEYSCSGHCIPKQFRSPSSILEQSRFIELHGGCESFRSSGIIKVKKEGRNYVQRISWMTKDEVVKENVVQARFKHMRDNACRFFAKHILTPFCKDMTTRKFGYTYVGKNNRKSKAVKAVRMCVAVGSVGRGDNSNNYKNMKCVRTR